MIKADARGREGVAVKLTRRRLLVVFVVAVAVAHIVDAHPGLNGMKSSPTDAERWPVIGKEEPRAGARRVLGVGRVDCEGSRRLCKAASEKGADATRGKKLPAEAVEECRRRAIRLNSASISGRAITARAAMFFANSL